MKIDHDNLRLRNRPLQIRAVMELSTLPSAIDGCRELVDSPQMLAGRK